MKKKMFVFAVITAMIVGCTACGSNAPSETVDTEVSTEEVIETIAPEVVPQEVEAKDLAPLADKGILTGVKDMTVAEGTKVDFNDLIYMDKTIVKGVDVDDSKVDYTKAGTYEVVYTITFDGEKLRAYIKENELTVNFDTNGDTIIVKTIITVEVVTKEEAETAIADGDTSVVTEETKADVQKENKAKANGNAVASTPAPENSGSKNNNGGSSNSGNKNSSNKNTGSSNTASNSGNKNNGASNTGSNTGNKNNGSSNTDSNTGNKNNGSSNTGSADKPSNGNNNSNNSGNNGPNNSGSNGNNSKPAEPTKPVEPEKPAHTHSWTPVTKTVHHDEVGHYETVTVQAAYDEPVYESVVICGGCGKNFGSGEAACEAALDHTMEDFYDNCENYHTEDRQVGTKHHDAVTEQRWVVDQKAYDETVTTGYKCSCGATK